MAPAPSTAQKDRRARARSREPAAVAASLLLAGCAWGCSAAPSMSNVPIAAAPPPKDDGKPAEGGSGGAGHAAALEQLKISALEGRVDKQNSVKILLPDAPHWTRVKFWGVPSLVGFRYGKDHHAIVAAFVTYADPDPASKVGLPSTGACMKSFEGWAKPWVDAFEVDISHEPPKAVMWDGGALRRTAKDGPQVIDIDAVFAKTATLMDHGSYAAVYGGYPAWKGACVIVGIAVPAREDDGRAREVRDRFAQEVLPHVEVMTTEEPKERY